MTILPLLLQLALVAGLLLGAWLAIAGGVVLAAESAATLAAKAATAAGAGGFALFIACAAALLRSLP